MIRNFLQAMTSFHPGYRLMRIEGVADATGPPPRLPGRCTAGKIRREFLGCEPSDESTGRTSNPVVSLDPGRLNSFGQAHSTPLPVN